MRSCLGVCFDIQPPPSGSKRCSQTTEAQRIYTMYQSPPSHKPTFQAMTCDEPTCWMPYFRGPLAESAPFRQSSKLPHQTFYIAYQTGPFARSCVLICGHPVLLPAQCPVLLRSPKVAQQQFKLPSIYWCLDAATVPGARDKI